ncbi:hypothetical protein HY416_00280 [Candidatus Kaiserbacteria bacterium]|nr:hypothetical protein [Candidatus Kaiserbacteria bacterium]
MAEKESHKEVQKAFDEAYGRLNEAQRKAVDIIEGCKSRLLWTFHTKNV